MFIKKSLKCHFLVQIFLNVDKIILSINNIKHLLLLYIFIYIIEHNIIE